MKLMQIVSGIALCLSMSVALASSQSPDVIVKNTVQEVMTTLRTDSKVTTDDAIRLVETKVFPHFDFQRITAQALGKHWASATPEQQKRLVREFQTLLVRAYVNQLIANRDANVEIKPAVMGSNKDATVTSEVSNPKTGQKLSLTYAFIDNGNGWKVSNVSVDGVSLVTSYRNSFNNVVRQSGIEGLLQKMAEKNQKSQAGQ